MPETLTREDAVRRIGDGLAATPDMVSRAIADGTTAGEFALQLSAGGRPAVLEREAELRRREADALAREIDASATAWSR